MDIIIFTLFGLQLVTLLTVYIKKGLANFVFILCLSFFLYGNSYLIDYWFFNQYINAIDVKFFNLYLIFSSFIFLFAFGAHCNEQRFIRPINRQIINHPRLNTTPIEIIYVIVFLTYLYFFQKFYSIAVVDRNYLYLNPNTIFSTAKLILPFYFLLILFLSKKKINYLYVLIFITFCLSELLIFGDRRNVASTLIAIFMIRNRQHIVRIKPKTVPLLILFVFTMVYIEKTRYGGSFFADASYAFLNPAVTELGAPWFIGFDIYDDLNLLSANLTTSINAILNLVPRAVWPERPLGAAAWFAQTYHPDVAAIGGGFAFSFILEIIINFSFLGYVVLTFLFGFFIAKLNGRPLQRYGSLLFIVLTLTLIFLPRYDLATILKTLSIYGVFSIPLLPVRIKSHLR